MLFVVASLGDKHADCPIFVIVTVPKFVILGRSALSRQTLVDKALRGFPNNKGSCDLLLFKGGRPLATGRVHGGLTDFTQETIPCSLVG
jgi:hypothetical protein